MILLIGCPKPEMPAEPAPVPDIPVSNDVPAPEPSGSATPAPTGGDPAAVACASEIALVCPTGLVDGCLAALTTHHACVSEGASSGPACPTRIATECPSGQIDGCLVGVTANHLCVVPPGTPSE